MAIENNSNYTYPITVAGPTKFTATATANTSAAAEAAASEKVFNQARATYGEGTTHLVGVPEYYVKLNDNKTYTATFTVQAEQIAPAKTPDPVPVVAPPVVPVVAPDPSPDPVPVVTPPVVPVVAPDPSPDFAPVVAPATIPDNPGLDDGPQIPNPIKSVSQEIPIGNQTTDVITPADPVNQPSNLQIANVNVISTGVQGPKNETIAQATTQDADNANTQGDWRVRLSLAPNSTYLYNAKNAGILAYLKHTNGVVFPYVPQIQVTYAANYETADIVHNNYKMVQYKNSSVDQITITGDFTAQDTYEANYMLAVIHFFRSVTKMFYGRDQIPKPGTPPPLCYLSGLGDFQFDYHPLVISSFNYNLPNDVDYIRASSPTLGSGVDSTAYNAKGGTPPITETRLGVLNTGATASPPNFGNFKATNTQPTYVPTKMSISITAFPMVTRNDISNRFSVKDYATGKLLQGRKNPGGGGIW